MKQISNFIGLVIWLLVVLAAALIAAAFSPAFYPEWYSQLSKPSWTPPDALFGPVWSILYLLMAIAVWKIWKRGGWKRQQLPLTLFCGQLILNAAWMAIFFGLHAIGWALVEIITLLVLIGVTIYHFYSVDRFAGLLLIPYLIWTGYATALTYAIWIMNSG